MVWIWSLFPIVHVISWLASEQTDWPASNGSCAHAGIAVAPTNTPANAAMPTMMMPRRPTDRPIAVRVNVLKVPP